MHEEKNAYSLNRSGENNAEMAGMTEFFKPAFHMTQLQIGPQC